MASHIQISGARARGYDRARTLYKQGAETIDFDRICRDLYPDDTERREACLEGLRAGWADR